MIRRERRLLILAGLVHLALVGGAAGLEIFRLGGEAEPRMEQPGINFHHLQWDAFEEQFGLAEEALAAGFLRPYLLSPGENIARTSVDRDGGPYVMVNAQSYSVTDASKAVVDGDPVSFYEWVATTQTFINYSSLQRHRLTLNLGGVFHVNRVRLFTSQSGHYPDKLDIAADTEFINSNSLALHGQLVSRVQENVQDTIDVRFPSSLARSVGLMLYRISPKAVTVAEVEIYGEGYINQAAYVGPFLDLGEPAIWGDVRWRGRKDPEAGVFIQSRSGKDLGPKVYWRFTGRGNETSRFDVNGNLLDAAAYALLKPGEAAPITYDTDNWSFWTAPYAFADSSGTPVLSPAPSSVLQLRLDFLSTFRDGGEVEFIEFAATRPPLVEEVVGEIYPLEVPLGEIAQFTYAIRPTIRPQHSGFDQVEIATPFGLAGVDLVKISGNPVEFEMSVEGPDSTLFTLQLPGHRKAEDSGGVIEVVFRAPVLRYSTTFDGWIRDTDRPLELAQRISPGNATNRLPSNALAVRTSFSERLLAGLQVEPRIATPNGDGVNETINFSFNLLQLTDEVPLRVEIFDLSGRPVRTLHQGLQRSGRFGYSWDGRDESESVVRPGLYIYRIAVEAGAGEDQRSGVVAVAY